MDMPRLQLNAHSDVCMAPVVRHITVATENDGVAPLANVRIANLGESHGTAQG